MTPGIGGTNKPAPRMGCQNQRRRRMRATFLSLHYHIVFSTRDRQPLIDSAWRARFHAYLAGTCRGLHGEPEAIGGMADHVHILCALPATGVLADFVRELKKASNAWVGTTIGVRNFAWQEGYAAFTVSPTARESVHRYIANQESHHRALSYQEEVDAFLAKAGILGGPIQ